MSNAYINFTFESKTDWVKKINECQKEIERQKEDKEELQGYYDILNHQCIEQGLEIERLNKQIEEYQKALDETTIDLEREKSQVKEYGTRLIKAIEYIEEQSKFIGGCDIYRICNKEVLLNILKGSDKE